MEEQRTGLQAAEGEADVVLPGFRFHPTDEELVGFYLRQKVEKKKPLSIDIIKQIDIYKHDPWDLAKQSGFGEKEWYFFSLRGRKYRNSIRPNRVTGSGFWKATGIDRPIYSCNPAGDCIGLKKSLVYYSGSAGKGIKTNWMMHEFRLPSCNEAESWTICRIFKRDVSLKKSAQQNLGVSRSMAGEGNSEAMAGGSVELQPGFANLNDDQIFREGNWDEIGRMVDYMMEPAITYDYVYF